MKRMLCAILCLVGAVAGGAASRYILVGDKQVCPKTKFAITPMVEIRNLRCYDGILEETGGRCTIVLGELWNMLTWQDFAVDLEIDVHKGLIDTNKIGTVKFHVERPGCKVPVRFACLIPLACYDKLQWSAGCKAWFVTRISTMPPLPH